MRMVEQSEYMNIMRATPRDGLPANTIHQRSQHSVSLGKLCADAMQEEERMRTHSRRSLAALVTLPAQVKQQVLSKVHAGARDAVVCRDLFQRIVP